MKQSEVFTVSKKSINTPLNNFLLCIDKIKNRYESTKDVDELETGLRSFAKKYRDCFGIGDLLLSIGERYITSGDYSAGIFFIKVVDEFFEYVANTTLLNLRMAEYHITNNETENGIRRLIRLCSSVSNYEESIEINELTEVWEKYKHLVQGKVAPSVKVNSPIIPLRPEECSMQINDILSLSDDSILEALSFHLGEICGQGDSLNCLNKWERIIYYADELCSEVNSGGFDGYLYYHGLHFEKAYSALKDICAFEALKLLDLVREKFPKNRIPKNEESLQSLMDQLAEKGVDFEREDELFYSTGEKELLKCLLSYVKENGNHLR